MSLLYWVRRLYSLDTLDTRFTPSANPLRAVSESQPQLSQIGPSAATGKYGRSRAPADSASQSRWKTPEFFVYYLVFIILVPLMFKTVIDVSQGQYPKTQLHRSTTIAKCCVGRVSPNLFVLFLSSFSWVDTWPQSREFCLMSP